MQLVRVLDVDRDKSSLFSGDGFESRRGLDLGNFIIVLSMLYLVRVLAKARKRPEIAK